MRKQGHVFIATLFITLSFTFSSILIAPIRIVNAETGSFPNSHTEINSMGYQTASRYIFSNLDRTTGINRTVTLSRTFPSDGTINVTEYWKANSSQYPEVDNDLYTYKINETNSEKQDFVNYPWFLAGVWMQRFPLNTSDSNITIAELSAIIRQKITGEPVVLNDIKTIETSFGQRNVFVVEIIGSFEQDCAT